MRVDYRLLQKNKELLREYAQTELILEGYTDEVKEIRIYMPNPHKQWLAEVELQLTTVLFKYFIYSDGYIHDGTQSESSDVVLGGLENWIASCLTDQPLSEEDSQPPPN